MFTLSLPPLAAACQSIGIVGLGFVVVAVLVAEAVER